MPILRKILKPFFPRPVRSMLKSWKILAKDYGHWRSIRRRASIDGSGRPVPWYSYPAIEYLKQLDFSDKTVFEYGSGHSTLFWSSVAKRVISVENNPEWHRKVAGLAGANCEIHLAEEKEAYINHILDYNPFDVIVVDGKFRLECSERAVARLKPGGFVILDNSDWFVKTPRLLRDAGLLEVDMAGFAPGNDFVSTTSFFFHREFNVPGRGPVQPLSSPGSLKVIGPE